MNVGPGPHVKFLLLVFIPLIIKIVQFSSCNIPFVGSYLRCMCLSVCVCLLFGEVDGSQTNLGSYPGTVSYSCDVEKIM